MSSVFFLMLHENRKKISSINISEEYFSCSLVLIQLEKGMNLGFSIYVEKSLLLTLEGSFLKLKLETNKRIV